MTTATSTFSWDNSSGATAKVWLNAVNDLVIAAGLTATTDTGQLDLTTAPTTFGSNASFGYRVYKFPDTLQATAPIFLRLDFYNDSAAKSMVVATVSAAADGAGNLASPNLVTSTNLMGTYQASIHSYACYVDGTFSLVLGYAFSASATVSNCVLSLVIDRARDATGTALAAGFLVESFQQPLASGTQSRSLYGAASPATSLAFTPALVPNNNAVSTSEGANVNVFRHYMMVPGVRPSLGCLTYVASEFGALTPFTATVLGSSHTWLPMGVAMTHWSATQKVAHCGAIRWE